jgi:CDGSH-type Zn-finger protein
MKMVKVVIKNSLKVIGKYTLVHEDGTEEEIDGKRAFCRCGLSSAMPFCDNTHQSKLKWVKKVEPDTTEDDWENEGGMALPHVDDNTPREELDTWRKKS